MVYVTLLSMVLAACSSGGDPGQPDDRSGAEDPPSTSGDETTPEIEGPPKTTGAVPRPPGAPGVEKLASGTQGQGPKRPRVVLASSALALSQAIDVRVPDAGAGTYLAAFWGEKPTGGYSIGVESANVEGDRATIRLSLKEPPEGAMLTQALIYPYATALVRGEDLAGKHLSLVDQRGRRLDWPVRRIEADG